MILHLQVNIRLRASRVIGSWKELDQSRPKAYTSIPIKDANEVNIVLAHIRP